MILFFFMIWEQQPFIFWEHICLTHLSTAILLDTSILAFYFFFPSVTRHLSNTVSRVFPFDSPNFSQKSYCRPLSGRRHRYHNFESFLTVGNEKLLDLFSPVALVCCLPMTEACQHDCSLRWQFMFSTHSTVGLLWLPSRAVPYSSATWK
jgi:hypothetical protein